MQLQSPENLVLDQDRVHALTYAEDRNVYCTAQGILFDTA